MKTLHWLALAPMLLGVTLIAGCLDSGSSLSTDGCNFQGLRDATNAAASLSASDRQDLMKRIDYAEKKFREGRHPDATKYLGDFRNKVVALRDASRPKIGPEDAATLLSLVDLNIGCVQTFVPAP
ncbi:MAG: hypothetical protein A2W00_05580 [Candidatus Eisenbacteria bacterium RBG_16_71_46]|nr:MAG: hypothetical protein A2W00_05580 [Candidatus Eisenbacteria bacterium RBG_16_71_46]OGF25472.1 MAG: hypothetical protein A2V63_00360 [Candidatus Eisenbacteria bacterium RBG_19FT_COMBO_70_11]